VLAAAADDTTDMGWNFASEAEELKEAFNSGGVEAFRALLEKSETSGSKYRGTWR